MVRNDIWRVSAFALLNGTVVIGCSSEADTAPAVTDVVASADLGGDPTVDVEVESAIDISADDAPSADVASDDVAGPPPGCVGPCDGDRVIATAADLAVLAGCTEISGKLTVSAPDITDLSGLECLTRIGGDLRVDADLETDAAVVISDGRSAFGAVQLTSFHGLERLTRIDGTLAIGGSHPIGEVTGTAPWLSGPVALTSLDGLDGLTDLGGLALRGQCTFPATAPAGSQSGLVALADLSALDGARVGAITIEGFSSTLGLVTTLPAVTVTTGANLSLRLTALVSLDGPTWPPALGDVMVHGNPSLTSISGLATATSVKSAVIRWNVQLPQCLVDPMLAQWGIPPDLGTPDEAGASGNNASCVCKDGAVVSCLPCIMQYEPITPETRCSLGRRIIASSNEPLNLPALEYADGLVIGASGPTTSLPALKRVKQLEFAMIDPGFEGPITVSLPALTTAETIAVDQSPRLTTVDLHALETVGTLKFMCPGPPGTPPQTPLAHLDLSSLTHADTLNVAGCSALPLCALEHDLASASVTTLQDSGLDAACQCDAGGDPTAGTCSP